jgi:hypothetical protein
MGDRMREGQAGNNPVVEASERDLLTSPAVPAVAWTPPALPERDAAPDADASPFQRGHKSWLRQGSQLLVGHRITARSTLAAIETELDRGAAFLLLPVFLAAGALVYFALPNEPDLAPLVIVSATPAVLAFLTRARPPVHYALAALAASMLGMAGCKVRDRTHGNEDAGRRDLDCHHRARRRNRQSGQGQGAADARRSGDCAPGLALYARSGAARCPQAS